jgi:hypothetical protein
MANSYRTTWTNWYVNLTGVQDARWTTPSYFEKSGPEISVYGYLNSNWQNFNESISNWVNSGISQVKLDPSSFSPQLLPNVPTASVEKTSSSFHLVGDPIQSTFGFISVNAREDNRMSSSYEIKTIDSGDCPFTGVDFQSENITFAPTGYDVVSSGTTYSSSVALAKADSLFVAASGYSPSVNFYTSFDPSAAISTIAFNGAWEFSIEKTILSETLSGKSIEQTYSQICG